MKSVEQRLVVLERELRRSRLVNRALVLACLVMLGITRADGEPPKDSQTRTHPAAGAPRQDAPQPFVANQILLTDRAGRTRLKMEVTEEGPRLCLLDEKQRPRLCLGQSISWTGVQISDSEQTPIATLAAEEQGRGSFEVRGPSASSRLEPSGLRVRDSTDLNRIHLALLNENYASLGISQHDQSGPSSIELTATDQSRSLKFHNQEGFTLLEANTNLVNNAYVNLRHPDHSRSLQITSGSAKASTPAITFFAPAQEDGTGGSLPIVTLGLQPDNSGFIRLVDGEGRPQFAAPVN